MSTFSSTTARQDSDTMVVLPAANAPRGNNSVPSFYFRCKAIVEGVVAAILLVPALPITGILVLIVRLTSRGPGMFAQERVGKGGKAFKMYKIRTMTHNAEAKTGPVWSCVTDPRITPIGRFLRKFHLDELPQLINVVRGEMSLVGPRPERPEIVEILVEEIPGYVDRLAVRPGITGLAQVNLPPDVDFDSVRHKVALDKEYIQSAGVLLDLRMFLCTAMYLVGMNGERVVYLLRLRREVNNVGGSLPSQNCHAPPKVCGVPVSATPRPHEPQSTSDSKPPAHQKPR